MLGRSAFLKNEEKLRVGNNFKQTLSYIQEFKFLSEINLYLSSQH